MTSREFLEAEAKRFKFVATKSWDGDMDIRSDGGSASDLMQLLANLQEAEYVLSFGKDNSVHVHAPHRKEHNWGDRGWDCTHGLTSRGCATFRS